MASVKSLLFLILLPFSNCARIPDLIYGLNKATDFALSHCEQINLDGLLGFVIAEAQILQTMQVIPDVNLEALLKKFEELRKRITPLLPKTPAKMPILEKYLLLPKNWMTEETFINNSLENLGIYQNWTVDDIVKNKHASYKGIPSDHCLMEILAENCYISTFCREMMLAPRVDTGYLLSHRLLYLQIVRLKRCDFNRITFRDFTSIFCSLMLREARTSDYLGFPAHDIALEQIVLCGIEGYSEFLNDDWRNNVLLWQSPFGCYKSAEDVNSKRSSNVIAYGCSDHTTGLGAAALAVNLRFVLRGNVFY